MRFSEIIAESNYLLSESETFSGVIPKLKYLNSHMITPESEELVDQLQSIRWWLQDNPGKTKEDWAKYWLAKAKPIPVTWAGDTWDMHIYDGHHRYLAYKILGLMPRVTVTARNVPARYIKTLFDEDDGSLQKGGADKE